MALQPEKGLGPILNALDIIVADTQQKRREVRDDRIRQEGFDREDTQRLQSGKIGALGKIFGIQGIDPAQKQKAFDTIIDTLANPDTDVGSFELPENDPKFGLTEETTDVFPTLEGGEFELPDFLNIQSQRTARQRATDAGKRLKALTEKGRTGDKPKKDTTRKDFVKNLNEFKDTQKEELRRITQPGLRTGTFSPKSDPNDPNVKIENTNRVNELQNDSIPELEKLERTVSGFRSTSIEELSKWFDRGWIEKDMLKELLIENGLLDEFNDTSNLPQKPPPRKSKPVGF